jgi:hypothetical protein
MARGQRLIEEGTKGRGMLNDLNINDFHPHPEGEGVIGLIANSSILVSGCMVFDEK